MRYRLEVTEYDPPDMAYVASVEVFRGDELEPVLELLRAPCVGRESADVMTELVEAANAQALASPPPPTAQ